MARAGQIDKIKQFWGNDIAQAACRYIATASMAWEFEWHAAATMQQMKSMHVPADPVDAFAPHTGGNLDANSRARALPLGRNPVVLPQRTFQRKF